MIAAAVRTSAAGGSTSLREEGPCLAISNIHQCGCLTLLRKLHVSGSLTGLPVSP